MCIRDRYQRRVRGTLCAKMTTPADSKIQSVQGTVEPIVEEAGPYNPKVILITGAAGFIASHVCILLVKKYPDVMVINYDKLDKVASLKNLEEIERLRNYKFIKGDIRSADLLNHVVKSEGVDTIMHFAAESHVDNSFGNSFVFTETNVIGTHTMMEVAKNNKDQIRRFIHVSTDEVYGEQNFEDPACQEHFVLEPTNPYAASKAGAELIAKSYMRSFGIPLIITRGNNVYGPHQFPEKMIPKFINQLMRDWPITLHGGGWTHRNMLFVEDVARAFDTILHNGKVGNVYNIGGEESNEISVRGVAEKILDIMKPGAQFEDNFVITADRVFNDTRYHIDSSGLHALGWEPQVSFSEGLKRTVDWYLSPCGNNWGDVTAVLAAHTGGSVITKKE
eukprot:TRINITY_DN3407_c0_g1_i3.p1 TRINITY_DN3407_c0_g1~~TRINITY_DN3407_c0_g1_i3.p1  ORF type:complete len:392 (-),score=113.09 TRINITY_DN3407_c0_g1_i3:90-1265(-)